MIIWELIGRQALLKNPNDRRLSTLRGKLFSKSSNACEPTPAGVLPTLQEYLQMPCSR